MSLPKKHYLECVFILLLIVPGFDVVAESNEDAPLLIAGTTKIFAEEVFELADKYNDLLIIDARIRSDRNQGHIQGSISLPDVETNCDALAKIIPELTTPVIFYCNGIKCGRSVNSSRIALECGYENIYWFRGGYEEWLEKNLPYIR